MSDWLIKHEQWLSEVREDTRTADQLIDEALAGFDAGYDETDDDNDEAQDERDRKASDAVSRIYHRPDMHAQAMRRAQELALADSVNEKCLGAWLARTVKEADEKYAPAAGPILTMLLEDPDILVLEWAANSLSFLGGYPPALDPLIGLSTHWNSDVRLGVARGLSSYHQPRATQCLIQLSRDSDITVRDWATFGLHLSNERDGEDLRQALVDRLEDEDAEVRGEAMRGLATRKDKRAIDAIRKELLLVDLEGDWALEAAAELADQSLYPDLLNFDQSISDEQRERFASSLNEALQNCKLGYVKEPNPD